VYIKSRPGQRGGCIAHLNDLPPLALPRSGSKGRCRWSTTRDTLSAWLPRLPWRYVFSECFRKCS